MTMREFNKRVGRYIPKNSTAVKRDLAAKVCAKYSIPMPATFEGEHGFERWLNSTVTDAVSDQFGRGEYLCALVHKASAGALGV